MVTELLTGLIVGTLLGLALAPLFQAWQTWRMIEDARRDEELYRQRRNGRRPVHR